MASVLDMLDEITGPQEIDGQEIDGQPVGGWGVDPRPVAADAGYGDATEFRLGLAERNLSYVVAVKATTSAYPAQAEPVTPPYRGRGRPPVPRYPESPSTLAALACEQDDEGCGGSPRTAAVAAAPGIRPRR